MKLQRSPSIPRIKLFRPEILLNDIFKNRYRITKVVERMNDVLSHPNVSAKDISDALRRLYIEELISEEQYIALSKEEDLNMDKLITEIKRMKISRGIDFLPRETSDLIAKLKEWLTNYPDE